MDISPGFLISHVFLSLCHYVSMSKMLLPISVAKKIKIKLALDDPYC